MGPEHRASSRATQFASRLLLAGALGSVAIFASGCNVGAGALAYFLLADDDDGGTSNVLPGGLSGVEVDIARVESARANPAAAVVNFVLKSDQSAQLDVSIEYSTTDASGLRPITARASLLGLPSSPAGIAHRIGWNALADLGDDSERRILLRATAAGVSDDATVTVGNDAPTIEVAGDPVSSTGGIADVPLRISDSSGDPVQIILTFATTEGGPQLAGIESDALDSAVGGADETLRWSSRATTGAVDRRVFASLTPRDIVDGVPGKSGTPIPVTLDLDGNTEPTVTFADAAFVVDGDVRRGQAIDFTVFDPDSDPVDVIVQWAPSTEDFEPLPEGIAGDPDARLALLSDPVERAALRVATIVPESIVGTVEASSAALDADEILATWVKSSAGLLGLRRGAGVATLAGSTVTVSSIDGTTRSQPACSYDPATGILRLRASLDPPAVPGDRMAISLGALARLESSPAGVVHRRIWASDVDAPGGGDLKLRVTPFDTAVAVVPTASSRCGASVTFPSANAILGSEGGALVSPSKGLVGPFGGMPDHEFQVAPDEIPGAIAVGDVDGDGREDVVVATRVATGVVFFVQRADGIYDVERFRDARIGDASDVAVEDLDGDGDLDVAVVGTALVGDVPVGALSIFFQEDGFDFISNRAVLRGFGLVDPSALAVVDADDDGDLDIVVSDESSGAPAAFIYYRGVHAGCEDLEDGYSRCTIGAGTQASGLAVEDLDDDGDLDLAVTSGPNVLIYRDLADGEPQAIDIPGASLRGLDVVDADDDGDADLVVTDADAGRVIVARFEAPDSYQGVTVAEGLDAPARIQAAQIDGRFGLDFLALDEAAEGGAWLGFAGESERISATFVARPVDPAPIGTAAALGDLDADGRVDLIAGDGGNVVSIWLQRSAGDYSSASVLAEASVVDRPRSIVAADFDGDATIDVAVLDAAASAIEIVRREADGTGTQETVAVPSTSLTPLGIAAADIDGDGRTDIATANVDSGDVTLILQSETGFDENVSLGAEGMLGVESVALADLDGDGRIDVLAAARVSGEIAFFLQRADGGFDDAVVLDVPEELGDQGPLGLEVADLDGDGGADVIVGSSQAATVLVFHQAADRAGYAPAVAVDLPEGASSVDVEVADLDGDGDGDIVVAALGAAPAYVIVQRDVATREWDVTEIEGIDGAVPTSIAVADFDGNGRGDVVLADANEVDPGLWVVLASADGLPAAASLRKLRSDDVFGPSGVVAVDWDADGDVDIISANRASQTLTLFSGGR